jgi:hypothetical protein
MIPPKPEFYYSLFTFAFLSSISLTFFGCTKNEEKSPTISEFTEVGEPILDHLPELANQTEDSNTSTVLPGDETNATNNEELAESVTEVEIILGQTLLSTEGNQSLPVINLLPPHDDSSGYQSLTYSTLTEFSYEIDWEADGVEFDFSRFAGRVPQSIRNLNGSKVALEGFMVPTVVDESNLVKEFLLMPDQLSCCFGQAPEANGWVVVRSEKGVGVFMDQVIRALGTLTVEERWDEEFFVGLYHLDCQELISSSP